MAAVSFLKRISRMKGMAGNLEIALKQQHSLHGTGHLEIRDGIRWSCPPVVSFQLNVDYAKRNLERNIGCGQKA